MAESQLPCPQGLASRLSLFPFLKLTSVLDASTVFFPSACLVTDTYYNTRQRAFDPDQQKIGQVSHNYSCLGQYYHFLAVQLCIHSMAKGNQQKLISDLIKSNSKYRVSHSETSKTKWLCGVEGSTFFLKYGFQQLHEQWTFQFHPPVFKKVTLAALNSLRQKKC